MSKYWRDGAIAIGTLTKTLIKNRHTAQSAAAVIKKVVWPW